MKDVLRNNFAIILGVSLPLIMAVLFLLTSSWQHKNTPVPQYAAVFTLSAHHPRHDAFEMRVDDDGKMALSYKLPDREKAPDDFARQYAEPLYIYLTNPQNGTARSFTVNPPADPVMGRNYQLSLPADLSVLTLDRNDEAADGYFFRKNHDGSYNSGMTSLFFGGGRNSRSAYAYVKDQYRWPVTGTMDMYPQHYNMNFIGWVRHD